MAKKITEEQRLENRLAILSKKDHARTTGLQNKFGLTVGDFLDILLTGMIVVEEHNTPERRIVQEWVYLEPLSSTWVFKKPRPEIGEGRLVYTLGDTYTKTVGEMESLQEARALENQKALEKLLAFATENTNGVLTKELEELVNKYKAK